jgi:hypothetical protein
MSWQNAPMLNKLTSSQQGGSRGAQLWGVDYKGTLNTIYQETPGGGWSGWNQDSLAGSPQCYELTAAQQNNGCCQLWVVDLKQQLHSISQLAPGGDWSAWS